MSIWERIFKSAYAEEGTKRNSEESLPQRRDISKEKIAFIDVEVGLSDHKIHDIGAVRYDDAVFHNANKANLFTFLNNAEFLCGHNIINHDAKYLFGDSAIKWTLVDTLYISPLLFPERPYHNLLKDDKLISDQLNDPVNDCKKCRNLLMDEINKWYSLPEDKKLVFEGLLRGRKEFEGFLRIVGAKKQKGSLSDLIRKVYNGIICTNADLDPFISLMPCELAYALALAGTSDYRSITPGWVLFNYPRVEHIVRQLRSVKCTGCEYCDSRLDLHKNLKAFFGYDQFRTYEGEPLQEKAATAATMGKSLLAIFPTGGGKSLTFQLPALMDGRNVHGLTVVISPLQSLMKDQVDNLADKGITDAVTINGLLDPISRSLAITRVEDGDASLLYIAPEMLRSKTIERILMKRNVVRFVIDEAHCFSSWGQDFRVDYLYIGKFIKEYQEKKGLNYTIPVSCFTATAKQKVIQDICDYFKNTLGLNLELYASTASRTNLKYSVLHAETDEDKYSILRSLITGEEKPVIVYVSRTKRTVELAQKLTRDGFKALPFNGKMDPDEKIANQEAFMNDEVQIMVATSAFGMGVDKSDVGIVIHYDISDSLENYIQEAGRAGRDPKLEAKCYVLFNESDLDKHFILLNQTKLSISEIQQVWSAIKGMTKQRTTICCSALEIARAAGWDDTVQDIETRVKTAISALEQAGYIERGNNVPHVFATGITVRNIDEARKKLSDSILFEKEEVESAVRIMSSLLSKKYIAKANNAESESRVDYLADRLGLTKSNVISIVERMRQAGILADTMDISAFIFDATSRRANALLDKFERLEKVMLEQFDKGIVKTSCRQLNDDAINAGIISSNEKDIRTILYFLAITKCIDKHEDSFHNLEVTCKCEKEKLLERFYKRSVLSKFIITWIYNHVNLRGSDHLSNRVVQFSVVELLNAAKISMATIALASIDITLDDIKEAVLYLSKIGAIRLEGGFLVLYNAMNIQRVKDNKLRYKIDDYKMLNEFYKQKIQQVHIVGEYANLMVRDYDAALKFVQNYFQMDYKQFINQYFKGERVAQIEKNITPSKFNQIFSQLSSRQMEIINDKTSRCIVVAAGPGSGKTRVLVHKLASLLMMEDVKHEQLLMLTFSRAAATEFKQRLINLIGNAAHFVDIKTFHSFCFDLLGRIGNLEESDNVVGKAAYMIDAGEVEPTKIGKTVLVIDEAQDMSQDEYNLVKALMNHNEEMRVIAVGDDDQNIFDFRGSDSKYMNQLIKDFDGRFYEMTENYRSAQSVVAAANGFLVKIRNRMKHTPIISVSAENGCVEVHKHVCADMYLPIAKQVVKLKEEGSICVLTQTNEEAVIMVGLLKEFGINSKLIQSMDGVRFWNLAEMRYFLKCLDKKVQSAVISENIWQEAKSETFTYYDNSDSISYVTRCIEMFEQTYATKYLTDFKEYVFESSIEDFSDTSSAEAVVSTIHKAKGREYDNVFMLINDRFNQSDAEFRRFYVGMTRAKKRLIIHTNGTCFDGLQASYIADSNTYSLPDEIMLQLSHKDVNLTYFNGKKKDILSLRGGSHLRFCDKYLLDDRGSRIAMLSKDMQTKIAEWKERGYHVVSGNIRFIVAWKPKDAEEGTEELAVILPDIKLRRT